MSGTGPGPFAPTPRIDIASNQNAHVEGDTGQTTFGFTVTRTGDQSVVSSASWSVLAGDTEPADYVGGVFPSGTVTFAVGVTTALISVPVAGDTIFETDESFSVQLANPVNCTIGTALASSKIINEPAHYIPASSGHIMVTVQARDINAPPSPANTWIKQMYVVGWRIAGSPETATALLIEPPPPYSWSGHVGPDGSVMKPVGQWFPSIIALQEAFLERWQEMVDQGLVPPPPDADNWALFATLGRSE